MQSTRWLIILPITRLIKQYTEDFGYTHGKVGEDAPDRAGEGIHAGTYQEHQAGEDRGQAVLKQTASYYTLYTRNTRLVRIGDRPYWNKPPGTIHYIPGTPGWWGSGTGRTETNRLILYTIYQEHQAGEDRGQAVLKQTASYYTLYTRNTRLVRIGDRPYWNKPPRTIHYIPGTPGWWGSGTGRTETNRPVLYTIYQEHQAGEDRGQAVLKQTASYYTLYTRNTRLVRIGDRPYWNKPPRTIHYIPGTPGWWGSGTGRTETNRLILYTIYQEHQAGEDRRQAVLKPTASYYTLIPGTPGWWGSGTGRTETNRLVLYIIYQEHQAGEDRGQDGWMGGYRWVNGLHTDLSSEYGR